MVTIYNRQVSANMSGGGYHVDGSDPVAAQAGRLGAAVQGLGDAFARKQEFDETIKMQEMIADGARMFDERLMESQRSWKQGDDIVKPLDADVENWKKESLAQFKSQSVRNQFNARALGLQSGIYNSANEFQNTQYKLLANQGVQNDITRSAAGVYTLGTEHSYNASLENTNRLIDLNDYYTPAEKEAAKAEAANQYSFALNSALINGSPSVAASAYGAGMSRAVGVKAPSPQIIGVSEQDQKQLANFTFDADYDEALKAAAGDDDWVYNYLKTALIVENKGFGRIREDAVNDQNKNGTTDYGAFQINSQNLEAYGITKEDAMDFKKSLPAMIRYAQDAKKQYGGNFEAAIAHYNGGSRAGQAVIEGKEPHNVRYLNLARSVSASNGAQELDSRHFALPPHWENLTFPQQQSLYNSMMSQMKARSTEFKSFMGTTYEQAMAGLKDGVQISDEQQALLSRENLIYAYGEYEGDRKFRALSGNVGAVASIPSLVNLNRAELEGVQSLKAEAGDTFKENSDGIGVAQTASKMLINQYDKDPVAYAERYDEAIGGVSTQLGESYDIYQAALQSGDEDMINSSLGALQEAAQMHVANLKAYQESFEGVPLHFGQAKLLRQVDSDRIINALNNGTPQEAAATLSTYSQIYGKNFGEVFSTLFGTGKVGWEYLYLLTASREYFPDLIMGMRANVSDSKALPIQSRDPQGLMSRIDDTVEAFSRTIPEMNEFGSEQSISFKKVLTNLAFSYARNMDNKTAVENAFNAITSNFGVSGTLTIPNTYVESSYGITKQDRADFAARHAQIKTVEYLQSHIDDFYVMDSDAKVYGSDLNDVIRGGLKKPVLHAAPDGSGVSVFVIGGNGVYYELRGKDGQQVVLPWGSFFNEPLTANEFDRIKESSRMLYEQYDGGNAGWGEEVD